MRYLLAGLVFFVLGVLVYAIEARGDAADQAYQEYEQCVEREYGRSAASYYQVHGEYPTCL